MKKFISGSSVTLLIVLLAFLFAAPPAHAQVVNETTKKKVSIGFGMFTDIWLQKPSGIKMRTINQGVNVFAMYNMPFGKSPVGMSIGLGVRTHNSYGNFLVDYSKINDTTKFIKIPDTVGYKRSKITTVYIDVPVEFFVKTKIHLNMALGFKLGMLLASHSKYVGDGRIKTTDYQFYTTDRIRMKLRGVHNLEQFTYGPYFRIGYKWINADCFWMLSSMFVKNKGPELQPISVGLVLMPF